MKDAIRIATDALIKPFEGYHRKLPDGSAHAYPDPGTGGAPWTIGWGTTGPDIGPNTVWTLEQCSNALDNHVHEFALGVVRLSPDIIDALPRRFAAIISFSYNCGLRNYRISTLRKRVNEQDWESAGREILKWNKAAGRILPGLTRRRQAESLMLIST